MFKVVCVAVLFAVVSARPQDHHHGHAYSSQSIMLHTSHGHEVHYKPEHHHDHHHETHHHHHEIYHPIHVKHEEHHEEPNKHEEHKEHHVEHKKHHEEPKKHHEEPKKHHEEPKKHHEEHKEHKEHHEEKHQEEHHVDYHAHPKYSFEYKVEDPHTGDFKTQHETRDGDMVHGFYTVHEADGRTRIVEYSADKHTGFKATVKHEGHATHDEHHH